MRFYLKRFRSFVTRSNLRDSISRDLAYISLHLLDANPETHEHWVFATLSRHRNLARTPDVAVVIHLNNFLGPVDDTVTAQKYSQSQSHEWDSQTRTPAPWGRQDSIFKGCSGRRVLVMNHHVTNSSLTITISLLLIQLASCPE